MYNPILRFHNIPTLQIGSLLAHSPISDLSHWVYKRFWLSKGVKNCVHQNVQHKTDNHKNGRKLPISIQGILILSFDISFWTQPRVLLPKPKILSFAFCSWYNAHPKLTLIHLAYNLKGWLKCGYDNIGAVVS